MSKLSRPYHDKSSFTYDVMYNDDKSCSTSLSSGMNMLSFFRTFVLSEYSMDSKYHILNVSVSHIHNARECDTRQNKWNMRTMRSNRFSSARAKSRCWSPEWSRSPEWTTNGANRICWKLYGKGDIQFYEGLEKFLNIGKHVRY